MDSPATYAAGFINDSVQPSWASHRHFGEDVLHADARLWSQSAGQLRWRGAFVVGFVLPGAGPTCRSTAFKNS
jgi:hypothetical protein